MEQLSLTILDYAVQLLAAAAFALFVIAVRAGVKYLTARIGGERVSPAMQLAATVVRALEQQGELLGVEGPRKNEMAIVMLRQLFGKFNIDTSEEAMNYK